MIDSKVETAVSSIWCLLAQDLADIIIDFIGCVDTAGYLEVVSKSWAIKCSEHSYRNLCIIYTRQTNKKTLSIANWHSWRHMLIYRPRIRINGFYWLRTSYWKPRANDNFWEEQSSECCEVLYLRFFNDGTLLYVHSTKYPDEILDSLKMKVTYPKKIYLGHYTLRKNEVYVEVPTHYAILMFKFLLQDLNAFDEGGFQESYSGKYNVLKMTLHSSLSLNRDAHSMVSYQLPQYCNFKFYRMWNWDDDRLSI